MTKLHRLASIGAVIGFAGLTVGLLIDPKTAFASYLVAWTAVSAVPIGALAVLFTAYLVRAGWTHDLHELLSGVALTIPVIAVLFIPVLAGIGTLYPWASGSTHSKPCTWHPGFSSCVAFFISWGGRLWPFGAPLPMAMTLR